jgi:hypothetical protein
MRTKEEEKLEEEEVFCGQLEFVQTSNFFGFVLV